MFSLTSCLGLKTQYTNNLPRKSVLFFRVSKENTRILLNTSPQKNSKTHQIGRFLACLLPGYLGCLPRWDSTGNRISWWRWWYEVHLGDEGERLWSKSLDTSLKFNSLPLKSYQDPIGKDSLPIIHFEKDFSIFFWGTFSFQPSDLKNYFLLLARVWLGEFDWFGT